MQELLGLESLTLRTGSTDTTDGEEQDNLTKKWREICQEGGRGRLTGFIFEIFGFTFGQFVPLLGSLINSDDIGDIIGTISLHFCTSALVILFEFQRFNRTHGAFPSFEKQRGFLLFKLFLYFLFIGKYMRTFHDYFQTKRDFRLIRDHQKRITETYDKHSLGTLIAIKKRDLSGSIWSLIENLLQELPLALFQLFLIFKTAKVGDQDDGLANIYRLVQCLMFLPLCSKKISGYLNERDKYLEILHFNSQTDYRVKSIWVKIFDTWTHLLLLVIRFGATLYYIIIFPKLGFFYLGFLYFALQLTFGLLRFLPITPNLLENLYQNPPFGVPTTFSIILDNLMSFFSDHVINYREPSKKFNFFAKFFALSCYFIVPTLLAMLATELIAPLIVKDAENFTMISANISQDDDEESYVNVESIVNSLLIKVPQNKSELMIAFGALLLLYYFCRMIIFTWTRLTSSEDATFPAYEAWTFYKKLLLKDYENFEQIRTFMIITLLPIVSFDWNIRFKTNCLDIDWNLLVQELINKNYPLITNETEPITRSSIREIINQQDNILNEDQLYALRSFHNHFESKYPSGSDEQDRKILLIFVKKFNKLMTNEMNSGRIRVTFKLFNESLEKNDEEVRLY